MLPAPCLIQMLWRKNKGWDEPLDEEDQRICEDWLGDLVTSRARENRKLKNSQGLVARE